MTTNTVLWFALLLAVNPVSAEDIPVPYQTMSEAEEGNSVAVISEDSRKDPEYSLDKIQSKIAGYQRMKSAGSGLLIGGIALDCIGTILLITGINAMVNDAESTANSDFYYDNGYGSEDPPDGFFQVYFGSLSLGFGIPMTIAGGVLSSIGSSKLKEYQERLKQFSLSVSPNKWAITYVF